MVGLTGNFGTGKSTVARFFQEKGAHVLSADRLAHEVFRKDHPLYGRLRKLFNGLKGGLTRSKIAEIVFRNPGKRKALESLIHPYVFRRIQEEVGKTRKRMVVIEVPLLFESGFDRGVDSTIVVKSNRNRVFARLARKGCGREEVRNRWSAQMPLEAKIRRADYWINNSNGRAATRRQVIGIWKKLKKEN